MLTARSQYTMSQDLTSQYLREASEYFEERDFDNVVECCHNILENHPSHPDALHLLGLVAVQQRDFMSAERFLRNAIKSNSHEPSYHNHLGNIFKTLGKYDDAIQAYENALALEPEYAEAYNNLGNVYYIQENDEKALALYLRATELRPDYFGAWYNLGLLHQRQDNLTQAIEVYKTIVEQEELYPAYYQLGKLYQKVHDYEKSIEHYEKVLELEPNLVEVMQNLGAIYLDLGQYEKAKSYLKKSEEYEENVSDVQFNLGVTAMRQGKVPEAIGYYQKALELDPECCEAHQNLANLYCEEKETEKAIEHYKKVLQFQPDNRSVQYMLKATQQKETPDTAPTDYVKNLFDGYAHHYEQHLLEKLDYHGHEQLQQLLTPYLEPLEKPSLLDLGCGTGLCGALFAPTTDTLIGIDLSPKMLEKAYDREIYTKLIYDDLVDGMKKLDAPVDAIIAADVFIYIGELADVFSACEQSLKPEGYFAFSVETYQGEEDYQLLTTARFSHSQKYIERLADTYHFSLLKMENTILRKHKDEGIRGTLFLFQNQAKG